mgnify:CR=1 FL=1
MSKKMRKDFYVVGRSGLFALTDKQDMTGKIWKTDGLGRKALPLLLERQNYTIIVDVE